ncbi:hypothetical protein Hdeb2414_s0001g00006021 [Helianthus debilis subsp. tardiflorus]
MNIFLFLCSLNVIFVDGTDVPSEDTIMIRCGSEIIPGPVSDGYLSYRFKVMPMNESSKKVLQVTLEILRDRLADAHEVCVIESGVTMHNVFSDDRLRQLLIFQTVKGWG